MKFSIWKGDSSTGIFHHFHLDKQTTTFILEISKANRAKEAIEVRETSVRGLTFEEQLYWSMGVFVFFKAVQCKQCQA